jgi:hypothetical protein
MWTKIKKRKVLWQIKGNNNNNIKEKENNRIFFLIIIRFYKIIFEY